MTEHKNSFCETESPPMVEARYAPEVPAEIMEVNATQVEEYEADGSPVGSERAHPEDAFSGCEKDLEKEKIVGAGVATGIVGCLLGGPILGLAFGFGAAHATRKHGALGDTARAVGDLALNARDVAREIDARHNVVERSTVVAREAWDRAQELDPENRYLDKGREYFKNAWSHLVKFVQRHNLIEKGVNTVGRGVVWTAEALGKKVKEMNDRQRLEQNIPVPMQPPRAEVPRTEAVVY